MHALVPAARFARELSKPQCQTALPFVTTGLDPVVHAEMQLQRPSGNSEMAPSPHGLLGQSPAMTK
jgi:hypothetical protein